MLYMQHAVKRRCCQGKLHLLEVAVRVAAAVVMLTWQAHAELLHKWQAAAVVGRRGCGCCCCQGVAVTQPLTVLNYADMQDSL